MIFLTVGTQFPFEYLVKSVDEAYGNGQLDEEIFAQIGDGTYRPSNFKAVSYLDKNLFDKYIYDATCIISHAGMGSISMALDNNKPLLVMPRRRVRCEVVNDHQVAVARKYEELGHILVAYTKEELPDKLQMLKHFIPKKRETQVEAVAERISDYLKQMSRA